MGPVDTVVWLEKLDVTENHIRISLQKWCPFNMILGDLFQLNNHSLAEQALSRRRLE